MQIDTYKTKVMTLCLIEKLFLSISGNEKSRDFSFSMMERDNFLPREENAKKKSYFKKKKAYFFISTPHKTTSTN